MSVLQSYPHVEGMVISACLSHVKQFSSLSGSRDQNCVAGGRESRLAIKSLGGQGSSFR